MDASAAVESLSKKLVEQELHLNTLHAILQLSARGYDVSPAAERVVRYCLYTPTGTTTDVLSLALDILVASPSHAFWVDVLSIILENLRRSGSRACITVLLKIPALPHSALQHLLLYSTTPLIACVSTDTSPSIRCAAVNAISSIVLRDRPLTAPTTDAIHLEKVDDDNHLTVLRRGVERLLFALLEAVFDSSDAVAITALTNLTSYSYSASLLTEYAPLNATKRATAQAIWHILTASLSRLSNRFASVFSSAPSSKSSSSNSLSESRNLKDCISSFSRMASHVLSHSLDRSENSEETDEELRAAQKRATTWVDSVLRPLSDHPNIELAFNASISLLQVCSYAGENPSNDNVSSWGTHAVSSIVRILTRDDSPIPAIVASTLVRHAAYALAALSKFEQITSKFVISSTVSLLPYAATCPGRRRRLELLTLLASTVIEYDLSCRDSNIAAALKAVLKSNSWRSIIAEAKTDSTISSELVSCFGMTCLEASKKIFQCQDDAMRQNLTHTWAVMLCFFMHGSVDCLRWPYSPASLFAKEVFLKVFTAAGQYTSYLTRSQNISLQEYERVQELLVGAASEQQDASIRASLLANITTYWLASGMKAQSNAQHIVKAVWKHLNDHFRDEEIFKSELKTGALWSEADKGGAAKGAPGQQLGYVSFANRVSKQTRAVIDTFSSTLSTAIENRLIGSVALSTAAAEGSTLTTDYVYTGMAPLIALVGHVPDLATKCIALLNKYILVMKHAGSADFIAMEAVQNTITVLQTYEGEHFPKPIAVRDLKNIIGATSEKSRALAWLQSASNTCVIASSRLEDPRKDFSTISTEEEVLRACSASSKKLVPFCRTSLIESPADTRDLEEGDSQVLHGCSDPFSVVASHTMDTVKGLAVIRINIVNRSSFLADHVSLHFSSSGALMPLPDGPTCFSLGSIAHGVNVTHTLTLAVHHNQSYTGQVHFSIRVRGANSRHGHEEEQMMIPYYIPSADVLLLRRPAGNAGVDVFRRRWDAMRESVSFHVFLKKDQSVDLLVDLLERKSKCLRSVGRMRSHSHVCAMVADSSRGNYVAVVALAPEARDSSGTGPCVVYMTIRSNSLGYSAAFRNECREWLKNKFRVIFLHEGVSEEDRALALRPQDAYFITDLNSDLSPYQRWRKAHAVRMSL